MSPHDPQICRSAPADAGAWGLVQQDAVFELFGGSKDWLSEQWTASDDRVRGGKSQSYLHILKDGKSANFCGNLDIQALGGAGFASQRTTSAAGGPWDLSKTSGLCIGIEDADERIYTLVVKDVVPPKRPDGRDESTISYEFSFAIKNQLDGPEEPGAIAPFPSNDIGETPSALVNIHREGASENEASVPIVIFVPWANFKPYYRGKKKPDAGPLNTAEVQRLSIMCRSMFGSQSGDFSMTVKFISAINSKDGTHHMDALCYPLRITDSTDGIQDTFMLYRSSLRITADTQR
ncbi:hypothetical protein TWF696_000312 [Orbilia brochopaga]|uniref:NADH:ubiquinone oxidoreductase intermediate-associated protein 30 domain-containing protein n=1 Tax=Orbilia brochopaga TaxID=3140254 RepID=A0AAV9VAW5_9PEZI